MTLEELESFITDLVDGRTSDESKERAIDREVAIESAEILLRYIRGESPIN